MSRCDGLGGVVLIVMLLCDGVICGVVLCYGMLYYVVL